MWAIRMNFHRMAKPAERSVNYQFGKCGLVLFIRSRFKASNHFDSLSLGNMDSQSSTNARYTANGLGRGVIK